MSDHQNFRDSVKGIYKAMFAFVLMVVLALSTHSGMLFQLFITRSLNECFLKFNFSECLKLV